MIAALEGWSGAAPALSEFRALLRGVEQIEAAGALHTAYAALLDLTLLVPSRDLRAAYARAQSGRVLRTLGLISEAEAAFEDAVEVARASDDRWLLARCGLGLGVLLRKRGRYSEARVVFERVLEEAIHHPDLLAGAHLGLVMIARAADEYDAALAHGWEALSLSRGLEHAEIEALAVLSTLSVDVGEYVAARRSCQTALNRSPTLPMRQPLIRTIVEAALALGDQDVIDEHLAELEENAWQSLNPWEQAHALRVLSKVHARHARSPEARACLHRCHEIACQHGYFELRLVSEAALGAAHGAQIDALPMQAARRRGALGERSRVVIQRLTALPLG
jgi:tetratricopeptide (TPR) repeat protein